MEKVPISSPVGGLIEAGDFGGNAHGGGFVPSDSCRRATSKRDEEIA
jgi:hypothetical protein